MNACVRFARFSLVGAMGTAIQLGALALFSRWMPGHYLYATAAAIELTLVHNFIWHSHYTWHDTTNDSARTERIRRFLRFHVSSGMISMLGSLAIMRILVGEAHVPVLVSNGVAVVSCSIPNFLLSNSWVFTSDAS
jgi:putative flippase GtrA